MIRRLILVAAIATVPTTAWGQELATGRVATSMEPVASVAPGPHVSDAPIAGFAGAAALSETDLGSVTGREDVARSIAIATQRNTVANNSVIGNSVTGGVSIDGNAFQNLQGLAVISANSGNNVAINAAMNVTINMVPTP